MAMTNDKVPNVRLRAAMCLHAALHGTTHLSQSLVDQINAMLVELQQDKDKDVRYFATHLPQTVQNAINASLTNGNNGKG